MITSSSNDKIKHIVRLLKSSQDRKSEGVFVVEGDRICREIPADRFVEGFVSEDYIRKNGIAEENGECRIYSCSYTAVSNSVYKKISSTVSGQGIIGIARQKVRDPLDFIEEHGNGKLRLLILENIQDPGNLGTMIRTAEAAGFDAIITDMSTVDAYNPKVIRSTMGGIFRLPVMTADDLVDFLQNARIRGISLYGAILDGSVEYNKCGYQDRLGILIGNEGNGLSLEIRSLVDTRVRIPMKGKAESLNAAVAAAILMYRAGE